MGLNTVPKSPFCGEKPETGAIRAGFAVSLLEPTGQIVAN